MKILLIETATQVCSIALAEDGVVVTHRESDSPNAHSSHLVPFVDEILKERHLQTSDIDGVCVSSGPGSYTGLRIGVSSAKGLCYASSKPLIAIPTLVSMAALYYCQHPDYNGLVCPMIDARRMECYTAIVAREGVVRDTQADIIVDGIYDQWLDRGEVTFIGNGAEKTQEILGKHANARYDKDFVVLAEGMASMAEEKLKAGQIEDVAYFEPYYLKNFVAKKSVVHGLR